MAGHGGNHYHHHRHHRNRQDADRPPVRMFAKLEEKKRQKEMRGTSIITLSEKDHYHADDDHDLYIIGAVCLSVCISVTKK